MSLCSHGVLIKNIKSNVTFLNLFSIKIAIHKIVKQCNMSQDMQIDPVGNMVSEHISSMDKSILV